MKNYSDRQKLHEMKVNVIAQIATSERKEEMFNRDRHFVSVNIWRKWLLHLCFEAACHATSCIRL